MFAQLGNQVTNDRYKPHTLFITISSPLTASTSVHPDRNKVGAAKYHNHLAGILRW
jgi:hypothetical protein